MDPQNLATFIILAADIMMAIDRFTTLAEHLFPLQSRLAKAKVARPAATSSEPPPVGLT
jgi:hypothetical protein